MTTKELIEDVYFQNPEAYKNEVAKHLRAWAETFLNICYSPNTEDLEEKEANDQKAYENINLLADKLVNGTTNDDDIEEIQFHLSQLVEGIED